MTDEDRAKRFRSEIINKLHKRRTNSSSEREKKNNQHMQFYCFMFGNCFNPILGDCFFFRSTHNKTECSIINSDLTLFSRSLVLNGKIPEQTVFPHRFFHEQLLTAQIN